jgi:ABC-2 type transport system ATP-binding protein
MTPRTSTAASTAASTAIVARQLTKRYNGFAAVDDVSFEIPAGQLVALLGPNGAGKTTTIEMLAGFTPPTSGLVRVLDVEPRRGGRAWRASVAVVLQSTSLDADLTVRSMLSLFAALYPDPLDVAEVLDLVDLTADASTKVGVLSGGQRRRVDVAIGMIGRPKVLFLDEPTTGLDPEARRRAWTGIENLTSAGTTILMTTHYIDEAEHLADRIIVICAGLVVSDTTPQALRAQGGASVIRYRLAERAPVGELPPELARHLDAGQRTLTIQTGNVTARLAELVTWAGQHELDLAGLEVGPPSLEDAYLAVTGESHISEDDRDA